MTGKRAVPWAVLLLCALGGGEAHADWLASQVQSDGSYSTSADFATPFQTTSEAVRTLRLFGRGSEVAAADSYLASQTYVGAEYLARKIVAESAAGTLDSTLVPLLLTYRNADGGFGELSGYASDPLDTAFALDALASSGNASNSAVSAAVGYLLQQQAGDGSWPNPGGDPDVYTTALAARALSAYGGQFAQISTSIANAGQFLLSKRDANGSWGADLLSAQALLTLATISADPASVQQSTAALTAAQRSDGSWSEDVYSTALALRALLIAKGSTGGPSATGGSIGGYVLSSQTNEPLANATVTVNGTGLSTQSGPDGYFLIAGVPAGTFTVLATLPGYSAASVIAAAQSGQLSTVGPIILSEGATTAVLHGTVTDASTQAPIVGATVALSGPSTYFATSAADGSFELDGITAGTYTVDFRANGYAEVSGNLAAAAGSVTVVRQALTLRGSYQDDTPGTISGQIIDAATGLPVAGAALILNGSASATSDSEGRFSFSAVARGSCQILASASGYAARTYSFVFAPGDSGTLGTLPLFAASGSAAPSALTLVGTVVDGVGGQVLAGASVVVAQTGQTLTTDANGQFTVSGLTALSFDLTVSAAGYQTGSFSGTASGYGQVAGRFALTPAGAAGSATVSTLQGTVTDAATGKPIAGATLTLSGTNLSAVSAADGSYQLTGIQPLALTLTASAPSYAARTYNFDVTQPGTYGLNVQLTASQNAGSSPFQILSFSPVQGSSGAKSVQQFGARIANLQSTAQVGSILIDVFNSSGATIATVSPYAPGTATPTVEVPFDANATVDLVIPWNTAQFAPGTYRLILRVVQPGTITKDLPSGQVLTQADTLTTVTPTASIQGQVAFNPPLSQAGSSTPVALSALIINAGNVPLTNASFTLTVADPSSGQPLTSLQAMAASIGVGQSTLLQFGSWVPTTSGNLPVTVSPTDSNTEGALTAKLYVGDKATGNFTVDKPVVPLGTQTVHANIDVQGVDVTTGVSTDPLFAAVKEAIRKGSLFVAPAAVQWKETQNPQCLGCHIQTQSFVGLAEAQQKAAVDPQAAATVAFLYNDIVGSQQADGGLYASHYPYFDTMQTALGIWALSYWTDRKQVFSTLYKASTLLLGQMSSSGGESWWNYGECGDCDSWWSNNEGLNLAVVTGYASLLDEAGQLKGFIPQTFALQDAGNAGNGNMMSAQQGPDGSLWYVDYTGALYAYNLATAQTRTIATGLANPAYGLAVRPDGTAYISSRSTLTRVNPDGTKTILMSGAAYGTLTEVAIGPDNLIYVVDHDKNCIWRVSDAGAVSAFACGGLITGPHGEVFDGSGNLLVTTNGTGDFRILRIAPDGTVGIFADGLTFPPDWIRLGGDGDYYVATDQYSSYQYVNPPGIYRVSPQGYVERIPIFNAPGIDGFNALAVISGAVYVDNSSNRHLYELTSQPLDTSQLAAIAATLPGVARYTLDRYQDNNPSNVLEATRIILLNEIRPHVQDPTLISQIDGATAAIATLLRQRQNKDGGWPYSTSQTNSDATTTAFVGLALQSQHPSVNDPTIRNSITYLVNSEQADGSWASNTPIFHRSLLGPASFVLDYLPQALEFLGGIDTGLTVTLPPTIQLTAPSIPPSTQSTAQDGSITYNWSLQGVTSAGENVGFDLTLLNMSYGETRAVASAAYLGFANSFTGETIQSTLTIPTVHAVNSLSLAVATDQASYGANSPVAIRSTVNNAGPPVSSGQVHVVIRAADGTLVADLGTIPFTTLATGASTTLPSTWNTGTWIPGPFEVDAQLYNSSDQLVDEETAPFTLVSPTAVVTAGITPDKTSYHAWDTVTLTAQVRNVSANAVAPPARAVLTVQTPAGAVLYSTTFAVNTLVPGSIAELPQVLNLKDAASGRYPIQLTLYDAANHAQLASASGSFQVNGTALQGLSGTIAVASPSVYQGMGELCTETVTNRSGTALSGVTLTQTLVNLATEAVIQSSTQTVDLSGQQQQTLFDSVSTAALPVGAYGCVLSATFNSATQQLGATGFQVLPPPIQIDASLGTGPRGRLLVLMDDDDQVPCGPIRDVQLWGVFPVSLPDDAQIEVDLFDAAGNRVDSESVALGNYHGTVDQSAGRGANLAIIGLSREVLTVELSSGGTLPTGYRLVARATSASVPSIVLDSGSMGSAQGWPQNVGAHFGDFQSSDLHLKDGTAATRERPAGPTLATQLAFLNTLLTNAGWSYTIVTEPEDFEQALRSGAYNEYAVLAQQEQLSAETREELREAVFRGEGLLYALGRNPGEDVFSGDLDLALGIRRLHAAGDAQGVSLSGSALGLSGSASFALYEDVDAIALEGAQSAGVFQGLRGSHTAAVTTDAYGLGHSVYVDYRLLVEATQAGPASLQASLLERALEFLQPAFAEPYAGEVIPLRVTLTNEGIATPGLVQLPLPTGASLVATSSIQVSNGTLDWPFTLAVGQQLTLDAWIRLSSVPGPVNFDADVQTGTSGRYTDYTHAMLTVNATAPATLSDALALAGSDRALDHARFWLERAQFWIGRGRNDFALASLLGATDALLDCDAPEATALRLDIDQVIWTVSQTVAAGSVH